MKTRTETELTKIINRGLFLLLFGMLVIHFTKLNNLDNRLDNLMVSISPDVRAGEYSHQAINAIPEINVYDYAGAIMERIYFWSNDGEHDYLENINTLSQKAYISTTFKQVLLNDYKELSGSRQTGTPYDPAVNQLSGVVKHLTPYCNELFNEYSVKSLERQSQWLVRVRKIHYDSAATTGNPLRTSPVEYIVRVTRTPIGESINEYGLQVDGWHKQPVRIDENQFQEECNP